MKKYVDKTDNSKNTKTSKKVENNEIHIEVINTVFALEIIVQKHIDSVVLKKMKHYEKQVGCDLCAEVYKPNIF